MSAPILTVLNGDALAMLKTLPSESVQCCVTSPPYWGLRDYGHAEQIGLEDTPAQYVERMVEVFREVHRVLKDDGTLWLNLGDSYAGSGRGPEGGEIGEPSAGVKIGSAHGDSGHTSGVRVPSGSCLPAGMHETAREGGAVGRAWVKPPGGFKPKDLIGIPWRVAFALQSDGWWLRSDIIWNKPNPMPESVTDRPTRAHEYIFLLSKSKKYFYDHKAISVPMTESSELRLRQNIDEQEGSYRANGGEKSNGAMKAVGHISQKQRGHGRRHNGFNDRWDQMDRVKQFSGMRNKRSVWTVAPAQYRGAHFATFPEELITPCILAGSPQGGGSARSVRRKRHNWQGCSRARPQRRPCRVESCLLRLDSRALQRDAGTRARMSSGRHTVSVTSFTPEALARIAARHATKNKTVRGRYNRADAAIDLGNTCDDLRAAWGKDAQAPSRELKPAMHRNGTAIDIAKVDAALRRYGKH